MSSNIVGHLDGLSAEGWLGGWAHTGGKDGKVELSVVIDGQPVARIVADQFRSDLAQAKFLDPSCAFVYKIPDGFRDGQPHSVEVIAASTGTPIRNSPQTFALRSLRLRPGSGDDKNFVPNAKLSHWPTGSFLRPSEKFTELAAGWYFDFRHGSSPRAAVSVDRPAGLGLREDEYALKVTLEESAEQDYRRIVVPISTDAGFEAGRYLFSCGFRRPHTSVADPITITEIFLGSLEGGTLSRVVPIKKRVTPTGTVRLTDIPVMINAEMLSALTGDQQLALTFEFMGKGELLMFSPRLAAMPIVPATAERAGHFEDPRIQAQNHILVLPAGWERRQAAGLGQAPETKSVLSIGLDREAPHSERPFVQIIIPIFNGASDTAELLSSIERHTQPPYEVLLFDDGSDAHTRHYLRRLTDGNSRVKFFVHDENVGYTRNINIALQSTTADCVVILNSDTVVTAGWLEKLYHVINQDPMIAGVGPVSNAASWQSVPDVKSPGGAWALNEIPAGYDIDQYADRVEQLSEAQFPEFPLLNGFCTLFRRSALEAVGLFDDLTFPQGYGEENDLCIRLTRAGYRLCVADHTFVYHKKSRSFGADRRMELSREAGAKLRAKFPELRIDQLETQMAANAALNTLRLRLRTLSADEPRIVNSAAGRV